jgi:hypothetical protein
MREIRYRPLDPVAFAPYGSYAALLDPDVGGRATPRIGAPPVEFFRDMLQPGIGGDTTVSFGVCHLSRRPRVIDASEYHDGCCEMLIPRRTGRAWWPVPRRAGRGVPGAAGDDGGPAAKVHGLYFRMVPLSPTAHTSLGPLPQTE